MRCFTGCFIWVLSDFSSMIMNFPLIVYHRLQDIVFFYLHLILRSLNSPPDFFPKALIIKACIALFPYLQRFWGLYCCWSLCVFHSPVIKHKKQFLISHICEDLPYVLRYLLWRTLHGLLYSAAVRLSILYIPQSWFGLSCHSFVLF